MIFIRSTVILVAVCAFVAAAHCELAPKEDGSKEDRRLAIEQMHEQQLNLLRQAVDSQNIELVREALELIVDSPSLRQDDEQEPVKDDYPPPTYDTMFAVQLLLILLGPVLNGLNRIPGLNLLVRLVLRLLNGIAEDQPVDQFIGFAG